MNREDEVRIDFEALLAFRDGFVIALRQVERVGHAAIDERRQRFRSPVPFWPDHRAGDIALQHHEPRPVDPGHRLTWIQLQRARELARGFGPVPVAQIDQRQRRVCLRQVGVDRERALGRRQGARECDARPLQRIEPDDRVGIRHAGVGQRVASILLDGLLKMFERRLETAMVSPQPVEPSFQVQVIRARVVRVPPDQRSRGNACQLTFSRSTTLCAISS